jgi:hypothetical protein
VIRICRFGIPHTCGVAQPIAVALGTRRLWGWRVGPFGWLLLRERVPYAVIGGTAVSYYLCGSRQAADLDVVVAPGAPVAERASAALEELVEKGGLRVGQEHFSPATIAEGADLRFTTRHGRLHLTGTAPGLDRARVVGSRRWVIIDRSPVAVCSLPELLEQKRMSPRKHDGRDLRLREQIMCAA